MPAPSVVSCDARSAAWRISGDEVRIEDGKVSMVLVLAMGEPLEGRLALSVVSRSCRHLWRPCPFLSPFPCPFWPFAWPAIPLRLS